MGARRFAVWMAGLLMLAAAGHIRPVAAGISIPAPYVEVLDVAHWKDFDQERKIRLRDGALDAVNHERDIGVRVLAWRLLSLMAVAEPAFVIDRLRPLAHKLDNLGKEIKSSDEDVVSLFFAARGALFALDPTAFPLLDLPKFAEYVAVGSFLDSIKMIKNESYKGYEQIRNNIRGAILELRDDHILTSINILHYFGIDGKDKLILSELVASENIDISDIARKILGNPKELDESIITGIREHLINIIEETDDYIESVVDAFKWLPIGDDDTEYLISILMNEHKWQKGTMIREVIGKYALLSNKINRNFRYDLEANSQKIILDQQWDQVANMMWANISPPEITDSQLIDMVRKNYMYSSRFSKQNEYQLFYFFSRYDISQDWRNFIKRLCGILIEHGDIDYIDESISFLSIYGDKTDIDHVINAFRKADYLDNDVIDQAINYTIAMGFGNILRDLARDLVRKESENFKLRGIYTLNKIGINQEDASLIAGELFHHYDLIRKIARESLSKSQVMNIFPQWRQKADSHLKSYSYNDMVAGIEMMLWMEEDINYEDIIPYALNRMQINDSRFNQVKIDDFIRKIPNEIKNRVIKNSENTISDFINNNFQQNNDDYSTAEISLSVLNTFLASEEVINVSQQIMSFNSIYNSELPYLAAKILIQSYKTHWKIHQSFSRFSLREAARIMLSRKSALEYAGNTFSSLFHSKVNEFDNNLRRSSDYERDDGAPFAIALRASGISDAAFPAMLDLPYRDGAASMGRFFLRLLADDDQRPVLDILDPAAPPNWERFGKGSAAAEKLFKLYQTTTEDLTPLRRELALRLAETAEQHGDYWSVADIAALKGYRDALPPAYRQAFDNRIKALERRDALETYGGYAALAVTGHAAVWLGLIWLYPRSGAVQAVFFWTPWVRNVFGLYAVPVMLLLPPLRRRLIAPFTATLVADAKLDDFDPDAYHPGSTVRKLVRDPAGERAEGKAEPLAVAMPEIRGHIVLEGASGLGKTEALRLLAVKARRAPAFLPARRIVEHGGVLEAIQAKVQGMARDPAFIRALLHFNALDVVIDGLNEVGADARGKIVRFVEDLPKANIILTTQPIAWDPPQAGATRRYELQPLDRAQIDKFLLSRFSVVADGATAAADYGQACAAFIDRHLSPELTEEERQRNLAVLSNPMDLTLVAEMIAAGRAPNLHALTDQQIERMEAWFAKRHQRPFPVAALAKLAYEQRKADRNDIDMAADELAALARHGLALRRERGDGKAEHLFRHDKIMEAAVTRHLLGLESNKEINELVGDPRFAGALIALAERLPVGRALALGKKLTENARKTGEHWVSTAFAGRMYARADWPRNAA